MTIHFVLLLLAFLCFFLASFGAWFPGETKRPNLLALGLMFWVLSLLVTSR